MKHKKDKHDYLEDNYPLCLQPIIEELYEEFDRKLKCLNEKHMEELRSLKNKITEIDIKVSNSDIAGLEGIKEYIRHIQEQLQNVSDKNTQLDTTINAVLNTYNDLNEKLISSKSVPVVYFGGKNEIVFAGNWNKNVFPKLIENEVVIVKIFDENNNLEGEQLCIYKGIVENYIEKTRPARIFIPYLFLKNIVSYNYIGDKETEGYQFYFGIDNNEYGRIIYSEI